VVAFLIAEVLFVCDLFLNFFLVKDHQTVSLHNSATSYLKSWFLIDFISTVVCNTVLILA